MNIHELKAKYPERCEREYQKWQEYACDHDWWASVYDIAKEDGKAKGFDIDDITFSGFWSQGAGASWEGRIDIPKYIEVNKLEADPDWFLLNELVRNDFVDSHLEIRRYGYSAYEGSMVGGGVDAWCNGDERMGTGVCTGSLGVDLIEMVDLAAIDDALTEAARDYAQKIYGMLETEYEYLTSEEEFIASCECNEIDFDEEDE